MNELNYVNVDFDSLVSQLQDRLKTYDTWTDTYASSTGRMIIELFAYVGNMVLYYISRRSSEMFIGLAQNRSSVLNLVQLLNYKARRKVSAAGTLTFSLATAHSDHVYIPPWTQCKSDSGMRFVTIDDSKILKGSTSTAVGAIQGMYKNQSTVSDGTSNIEILINNVSVENTHLYIYVNNILWTKVDSFIDSTVTNQHYTVLNELDDKVTIRFGDGKNGVIPELNKTIDIRYVESRGIDSNVYEIAKITSLYSKLYDGNNTEIDVTVSNTTTFLGGDDKESTESIQANAPNVFAAGDRLTSISDYLAVLNAYPGVANAKAWGERYEDPPNELYRNTVRIAIILQNWALPSTFVEVR